MFDYHLTNGSPSINRGSDLSVVSGINFNYDIENKIRPQGLAWDIGAYEYSEFNDDTQAPASPQGLSVR
jgi:hypothetical protein